MQLSTYLHALCVSCFRATVDLTSSATGVSVASWQLQQAQCQTRPQWPHSDYCAIILNLRADSGTVCCWHCHLSALLKGRVLCLRAWVRCPWRSLRCGISLTGRKDAMHVLRGCSLAWLASLSRRLASILTYLAAIGTTCDHAAFKGNHWQACQACAGARGAGAAPPLWPANKTKHNQCIACTIEWRSHGPQH
jgi:hypothetical protein